MAAGSPPMTAAIILRTTATILRTTAAITLRTTAATILRTAAAGNRLPTIRTTAATMVTAGTASAVRHFLCSHLASARSVAQFCLLASPLGGNTCAKLVHGYAQCQNAPDGTARCGYGSSSALAWLFSSREADGTFFRRAQSATMGTISKRRVTATIAAPSPRNRGVAAAIVTNESSWASDIQGLCVNLYVSLTIF